MRAPSQDLRPIPKVMAPQSRPVSFVLVALLHVVIVYALASGLAHQMVELLPQNINVNIIPEAQQKHEPPPPPPPTFNQPPPFVPPPDVTIDLSQAPAATNAITAQSSQTDITAPASVGACHSCTQLYPPGAIAKNEEGITVLTFRIGTDGGIKDIQLKSSSGFTDLDETAVRCVSSRWHYKPAMLHGQPVEVPWQATIKWQLKGAR